MTPTQLSYTSLGAKECFIVSQLYYFMFILWKKLNGHFGQPNSRGGHTLPTQGTLLEHPVQVIKKTAPLGPTEHLLHKASLPRLGDIADLPNT